MSSINSKAVYEVPSHDTADGMPRSDRDSGLNSPISKDVNEVPGRVSDAGIPHEKPGAVRKKKAELTLPPEAATSLDKLFQSKSESVIDMDTIEIKSVVTRDRDTNQRTNHAMFTMIEATSGYCTKSNVYKVYVIQTESSNLNYATMPETPPNIQTIAPPDYELWWQLLPSKKSFIKLILAAVTYGAMHTKTNGDLTKAMEYAATVGISCFFEIGEKLGTRHFHAVVTLPDFNFIMCYAKRFFELYKYPIDVRYRVSKRRQKSSVEQCYKYFKLKSNRKTLETSLDPDPVHFNCKTPSPVRKELAREIKRECRGYQADDVYKFLQKYPTVRTKQALERVIDCGSLTKGGLQLMTARERESFSKLISSGRVSVSMLIVRRNNWESAMRADLPISERILNAVSGECCCNNVNPDLPKGFLIQQLKHTYDVYQKKDLTHYPKWVSLLFFKFEYLCGLKQRSYCLESCPDGGKSSLMEVILQFLNDDEQWRVSPSRGRNLYEDYANKLPEKAILGIGDIRNLNRR